MKYPIRCALIAATFSVLAAPTYAQTFDFKGISIGQPATPEQVKQAMGVDCGPGINGMQVCNGRVPVGSYSNDVNLVISPTGNIQRISLEFSSSMYEGFVGALTDKYGKPTDIYETTLQNGYGAQFRQTITEWKGSNEVMIQLVRYHTGTDTSRLYYSTKEDRDMLNRNRSINSSDF